MRRQQRGTKSISKVSSNLPSDLVIGKYNKPSGLDYKTLGLIVKDGDWPILENDRYIINIEDMRKRLADLNRMITIIRGLERERPGIAAERGLNDLCSSRDNLHNIISSMQTMMIMSTSVNGYEEASDAIMELIIYPIMDTTSSGKDTILLNDANPDWFAACSRAYFMLDEGGEAYLTASTKGFDSKATKISHVLLNNMYGMIMPILECSVSTVYAYKNYQYNPTGSRATVERSASARIVAFNLRSPRMATIMRQIAMIQLRDGKLRETDPFVLRVKERYENDQLKHGRDQSACNGSVSSTVSGQHSSECGENT